MNDHFSYGAFINSSTSYPVNILGYINGTGWTPLVYDEGGTSYPPYFPTETIPLCGSSNVIVADLNVDQEFNNYNFSLMVQNYYLLLNSNNIAILATGNQFFSLIPNNLGVPDPNNWPIQPPPYGYDDGYDLARTLPIVAGTLYDIYFRDSSLNWNQAAFNIKNDNQVSQSTQDLSSGSYTPSAGQAIVPIILVPVSDYVGGNCSTIATNRGCPVYTGQADSSTPKIGFATQDQCNNGAYGQPVYDFCGNGNFGVCDTSDNPTCISQKNNTTACGVSGETTSKSYTWLIITLIAVFIFFLLITFLIIIAVGKMGQKKKEEQISQLSALAVGS